jgi:hypothetical protein
MKNTLKQIKLALIACIAGHSLMAQPVYEWSNALNGISGSGAQSHGYAVATDPLGNNYSVGYFTGTIDFDPGAGTFNMTTSGSGMFVRKLDAAGNFLWAKMASSTAQSEALDVVATATNVYVTGYFAATVDFDPGAGVVSKTSSGGSKDMFLWDLTSAGNYNNVFTMGSTGDDRGSAIDMHGAGMVVAGVFTGSYDANPTATVTTITSNGGTDIFIAKFSLASSLTWIKTFGSVSNDASAGITNGPNAIDIVTNSGGNIYTTGEFGSSMDIDPGAGTVTVVGSFFVQKLTSGGNFSWGNATASGAGLGIDADNSGNVYTTGWISGNVDMDPGAGITMLNASSLDMYVRKLDGSGNFSWAINIGAINSDQGRDIVLDPSGNLVVTGWYQLSVDFDPSGGTATLANNGGMDVFIASYDNTGGYLWAKKIGSSSNDMGLGITCDYSGSIYTCGTYKGSADFHTEAGTYTMPLAGFVVSPAQDAFLHKLGSNCSSTPTNPGYEWATDAGGTGNTVATAVETDASGNVYTTGHFSGMADFDPTAGTFFVTAADFLDIFVQKQDASGNLLWVRTFGGKGYEYGYTLSLDASGNVAIGGTFNSEVDLDPGAGTNIVSTNGAEDIIMAKLDPSGNLIWSYRIGGTGVDKCWGIDFDGAGYLGATGSFSGAVDFDPNAGVTTLTGVGASDIFVLRLNAAGLFSWAKQRSGTGSEEGKSICFDASNNIYVTGNFSGTVDFNYPSAPSTLTSAGSFDGFVMRMSAVGSLTWVRQIGGASLEQANDIVFDSEHNFLYIGGLFSGSCSFNGTSLTSLGFNDAFMLKMNTSGTNSWVKQVGQVSGIVTAQSLTTDDCGDVYATGYYTIACDFDPNSGTFTLAPVGNEDAFILKLQHSGAFCWAKSMGGTGTDLGYGVWTDAAASVYTSGVFAGTADFNPGGGTNNLVAAAGLYDAFVQKLNTSFPVRLANENNDQQTIAAEQSLTLFPNPSNGLVTLKFNTALTGNVEVFDMTGQQVMKISLNESAQQEIDLSGYAKGIYLVRVSDGSWSETRRIVIE